MAHGNLAIEIMSVNDDIVLLRKWQECKDGGRKKDFKKMFIKHVNGNTTAIFPKVH